MKAKPIKEILSNFLQGSDFEEINLTINISKAWTNLVGDLISKNTEVQEFKNGKLTIKTSNPVWRNELTLQKSELIGKLREVEPKNKLTEIIFK